MSLGYCFFNSYVYVSAGPPPNPYVYAPFTGAVVGTGAGTFDRTWNIEVDPQQFVYVCGLYNTSANIYDRTGTVLGTLPTVTGDAAFACKFSNVGTLQYSLVVDSAGSDIAQSITTDSTSNVYLTGYYAGTPNIIFRSNSNASTTLGTLPASTGNSVFSCKFSSTGTLLYSLVIDGSGSDAGYGSAVDSLNNFYTGGNYNGTPNIVFRSSSNVSTTLGTLPASSGDAAFTTKFSSTGDLQYSFIVDATTNADRSWALACDAFSNVYFGGQYNGTPNIVFRSNSNVSTTLGTLPTTLGTDVAFATKCNDIGSLQYSLIIDGTGSDIGYSLACDTFSNIYIGGQYTGTPNIIFRSNANVSTTVGTLSVVSGSLDGFVTKFSSTGTLQYSYIVSGAAADSVLGVSRDANSNVVVGGYYNGTPSLFRRSNANVSVLVDTFPTSTTDAAFMSKFDSNGRYFFSITSDSSVNDVNYTTQTDQNGNLYFGGQNQNGPLRDATSRQFLNYSIITPAHASANTALPPIPARLGAYYTRTTPTGSTGIPQLGYYTNFARIVNAGSGSQVNGLACDTGSNLYAAYNYNGTTPNIIDTNLTVHGSLPTSVGQAGALTKFDSVGTVLFSRIIDSSTADAGNAVAVDSTQSNVYLGTNITGAVTVKNQTGTSLGTIPAPITNGACVSKFSTSTGDYQYSVVLDASGGNDVCQTVSCDPFSNVYFGGFYTTGTVNISYVNTLGAAKIMGTFSGNNSGFLTKCDQNGNLLYTLIVNIGGGIVQSTQGSACDPTGNVYMSGYNFNAGGTIVRVSSSNVSTTLGTIPTPSNYAAFTVKCDLTGNLLYSLYIDSTGTDIGYSVSCDPGSNVYVSGQYNGTPNIIFRSSANVSTTIGTLPAAVTQDDAFMTKFSSTGTLLYSYTLYGTGTSLEISYGTTTDINGNVYFTGEYNGTPTLRYISNSNVATTVTTLPASSGIAAFVISISPTGTFNYARVIDATTNADKGYAVACDPGGNVFFGGQYNGITTIRDHLGTTIGSLPNLGARGFITKFAGSSTPIAQNLPGTLSNVFYTTVPFMNATNESRLVDTDTDTSGNVFIISQRTTTAPVLTSKNAVTIKTMPPTTTLSTSLVKFNNKGLYEWDIYATNFGINGSNIMCSLTHENSNVYIGSQQTAANVVTFYNTSNVVVGDIPASASADTSDCYVAKFDTNGTFQWKSYVQGAQNFFPSVAASPNDNAVYLAGTKGTAQMNVFSTSNVSVGTIPSTIGSFAGWLTKYNRDGVYQWRTYIDSSNVFNRGVTTDSKSNVYITGYFTGTTTANVFASTGSTRAAVITKSGTNDSLYLVKYLTDGSFSWYAFMNTTGAGGAQQFGHGCDPKSNVYVAGFHGAILDVYDRTDYSNFRVSITGGSGTLIKFSEAGFYQWYARAFSPTSVAFDKVCTDIDFDAGSNVYATFSFLTPTVGGSTSTITIRDGLNTNTTIAIGVISASFNMVVKFSESGVFQWACPQTTVVPGRCNSTLAVFGSNVYTSGTKLTNATTVRDRNFTNITTIPVTTSNAAYVTQYFTDGTYAVNDFQVTNFSTLLNIQPASGGTITGPVSISGITYYIHVFTTSGTLTVPNDLSCDILVVGGGGGGGFDSSGGGGAGGYSC